MVSNLLHWTGSNTQSWNVGLDVRQYCHLLMLYFFSVVQSLYERSHNYANLANRSGAVATDLMLSCRDFDVQIKDLTSMKRKIKKRKRRSRFAIHCVP